MGRSKVRSASLVRVLVKDMIPWILSGVPRSSDSEPQFDIPRRPQPKFAAKQHLLVKKAKKMGEAEVLIPEKSKTHVACGKP